MSVVPIREKNYSATQVSLISRVRQNDANAWQEFVALYSPLVCHWCRKQGMPEADINDVKQDVFFAVARSIDSYSPQEQRGGFRAWLWTISRNKLIDWVRKKERLPDGRGGSTALHSTQQIPDKIDESETSEQLEISKLLHRALEQVRCEFESKTWQAFWRCVVEDVATPVVAEELGLSTSAIRKYRSRVLRRLRQQLGEME